MHMRKNLIIGSLCVFLVATLVLSTVHLINANKKKQEEAKQTSILTKRFSVSEEYVGAAERS